ncbi:MAG: CRISPR-associated endoribonuclease Cas6 [Candidatus Altarchaeaceae archaeon]
MIEIKPRNENFAYSEINKYFIHSWIWNLLRDTEFSEMHDKNKFKFFTFSDIFPISDFSVKEKKKLIISSPNEKFIEKIYEKIRNLKTFKLGIHEFEIVNFKKFFMKLKDRWQTGTPIVLYEDNRANRYYSVKRNPDLNFFLKRIKENALKKYNAFYNENLNFEEPLFDRLFFKKQTSVHLRKNNNEFLILGTLWEFEIDSFKLQNLYKFYNFLMECGLGEKNSLGFGFVNMKRNEK